MKIILIFFCLLFIIDSVISQSVSIGYTIPYTLTKEVVPIVNGKKNDIEGGAEGILSFSYEHTLKNKKYALFGSYIKFKGCTFIYFEDGGWIENGVPVRAQGFCNGVNIERFDVGLSYLITPKGKKFYIKPFAALGLQTSPKTGVEFWRNSSIINGPDYFELEPMDAVSMKTTQIVPSIGFRAGFIFWKRLDIGIGVQGVYAFKPYQKMYLKYQYKGVIQPTAEYESTGTGLFNSLLSIGYRFVK